MSGGIPDIDKLFKKLEDIGEVDVRKKLAQGIWGKTGSTYDLIQTWLAQHKENRQNSKDEAAVDREERSITISNKAMKASYFAVIVSIVAILVAIFK